MAEKLQELRKKGGGGTGPFNIEYFYGDSTTSTGSTFTFPESKDFVYVVTLVNSGNATYSGSGTMTEILYSSYIRMYKIRNVTAGDTFSTPGITFSGAPYSLFAVIVPDSSDFFEGQFYSSSPATFTFSKAITSAYILTLSSSTTSNSTYTGSGTMTKKYANSTIQFYKIENISNGNTFKSPSFSTGGASRDLIVVFENY